MPDGPDVRIGIVSYNTAALLDRCLAALPEAVGSELRAEVVVVDNASADDSVRVAEGHAGVRVVPNGENVGYARGMNAALAGSVAPVLVALNPDSEPRPGSLAVLVETLRLMPAAGLVVPVLRNVDGTVQHSVHRFPSPRQALVMGLLPPPLRRGRIGERWWLEGHARFDRRTEIDWAVGAVHAVRRAAVADPDHVYDERWFMYAEDMELCWRLRGDGWRVLLEPRATVVHVGNAAGEVAFGAERDARWLASTYDWYEGTHGPRATRAWSAANCGGLAVKWAVARATGDRPHAARLRSLLALHRRAGRAAGARAGAR